MSLIVFPITSRKKLLFISVTFRRNDHNIALTTMFPTHHRMIIPKILSLDISCVDYRQFATLINLSVSTPDNQPIAWTSTQFHTIECKMKRALSLPSRHQSIYGSIQQYSRMYASYATFHPCGHVLGRMTPQRGEGRISEIWYAPVSM